MALDCIGTIRTVKNCALNYNCFTTLLKVFRMSLDKFLVKTL